MLALVTATAAADFDADLDLLVAELGGAEIVAWDDEAVEWGRFDAAIIRSTWDYHTRREEFLGWARRVATATALWNPVEVLEWNTDKRYLRMLAARGIAVVPTVFVDPGETVDEPRITELLTELDGDVVVKPSVGAGSQGVHRCRGDVELCRRLVDDLLAAGATAMLQPYQAGVDVHGETSLMYLGGEFSHAIRKRAILAGEVAWTTDLFAEEQIESREPSLAERSIGDAVVAALPDLAYARVDLLPTPDGPVLLELELVEPSLFLDHADGAASRAAAVFDRLRSVA